MLAGSNIAATTHRELPGSISAGLLRGRHGAKQANSAESNDLPPALRKLGRRRTTSSAGKTNFCLSLRSMVTFSPSNPSIRACSLAPLALVQVLYCCCADNSPAQKRKTARVKKDRKKKKGARMLFKGNTLRAGSLLFIFAKLCLGNRNVF